MTSAWQKNGCVDPIQGSACREIEQKEADRHAFANSLIKVRGQWRKRVAGRRGPGIFPTKSTVSFLSAKKRDRRYSRVDDKSPLDQVSGVLLRGSRIKPLTGYRMRGVNCVLLCRHARRSTARDIHGVPFRNAPGRYPWPTTPVTFWVLGSGEVGQSLV